MKLSTLIKAWDVLHVDDIGHVAFCDLVDMFDKSGKRVVNDLVAPLAGAATPAGLPLTLTA